MDELTTPATAITFLVTPDPLDLIESSDKATSTKRQYTRALKPYLDIGGAC